MFGVGSMPAWLSRSVYAGDGPPQAPQENPGRHLPARRSGRPEHGGPFRRTALLRICGPPSRSRSPTARRTRPSIWTDSSACIPSLAPLKPMFDARHLAIVDAVGSPDPTRSHFDAQDYMESGTPGMKATTDGWMNRALPKAAGPRVAAARRQPGLQSVAHAARPRTTPSPSTTSTIFKCAISAAAATFESMYDNSLRHRAARHRQRDVQRGQDHAVHPEADATRRPMARSIPAAASARACSRSRA